MLHYTRMTIFQNRESARTLDRFKKLIETYFANLDQGAFGLEISENLIAKRTRSRLNLGLEKAKMALCSAEVYPVALDERKTHAGEGSREIDLLENLFRLHQYKLSPQIILDYLDRARGIYNTDRARAMVRTINPFYWLDLLVAYAARAPFHILGMLGLDRARMEESAPGKFLKGSVRLALLFALLLWAVQALGYLEPIKSSLRGPLALLRLNGQELWHQLEQRTDAFILKIQGAPSESRRETQDPAT